MKAHLPDDAGKQRPHAGWVWLTAIRPRTLSISATPVLVGTALAMALGADMQWPAFLAALACAFLIQVGTNLHNDAADFERGNDQADRIGPLRVTAAGWVTARQVRRAAVLSFVVAMLLGIYLVSVGGWPILAIGLASLLAGWIYSGGPRPISHTPLGELFVITFFGVLAVFGSSWLQSVNGGIAGIIAGLIFGLPAAAVLLINNYRDLESDVRAGRRTLVAVLGRPGARSAFAVMMLAPYGLLPILALCGFPGVWLALAALPLAIRSLRGLAVSPIGPELNDLLAATARAGFALGVLLAAGLVAGGTAGQGG